MVVAAAILVSAAAHASPAFSQPERLPTRSPPVAANGMAAASPVVAVAVAQAAAKGTRPPHLFQDDNKKRRAPNRRASFLFKHGRDRR